MSKIIQQLIVSRLSIIIFLIAVSLTILRLVFEKQIKELNDKERTRFQKYILSNGFIAIIASLYFISFVLCPRQNQTTILNNNLMENISLKADDELQKTINKWRNEYSKESIG